MTAAGGSQGGVAWWAHIGGFLAGLLLIVPFQRAQVPRVRVEAPLRRRGPWSKP